MGMPSWLENIVFYEIYPQTFLDTDGDGIGNIQGIIRKLDYIKNLGCDGIWLNPCFASPFYDAGYDVADYKKVAPRYGTNEDLKELFRKAHEKGMKVLLDLVPGHTSTDHEWFRESCKAEKNEYTDRYVWTDDIWDDFKDVGSITGSIRGFSDRNGCCAVNFFSVQPALNFGFARCDKEWQQPMDAPGPMATREAIKDVMRFWMSMGCDGFRVEEPYFSRRGKGDISEFVKTYEENYAATNREGLICIPSGNHDMVRIKETLDDEEIKIAFAFLLSVPGAPFIYYGDEIGMKYLSGIKSVEGGFNRTGSRSPMQWDHSANAGFSSCKPEELYIQIDPDEDRPTAEDALAGKNSLYDEVKKLIAVRKEHQALQNTAPMEFVYVKESAYPLVYKRTGKDETIYIVLNPSGQDVECDAQIPQHAQSVYSNNGEAAYADGKWKVPAASATFLKVEN